MLYTYHGKHPCLNYYLGAEVAVAVDYAVGFDFGDVVFFFEELEGEGVKGGVGLTFGMWCNNIFVSF